MSTISILMRQRKDVDEELFKKIPAVVLVDVGEEVEEFLSVCDDVEEFGASMESMLEEVFMYLADSNLAEEAIEEMRKEMYSFYQRDWSGVNPGIIADAFESFAKAILEKLKLYRIYTQEGVLPYVMHRLDADGRTIQFAKEAVFPPKKPTLKNTSDLKIHHSLRLYGEGVRKHHGVPSEKLSLHLEEHKLHHEGCALFIDGACVHRAGFSDEVIGMVEEELCRKPVKMTRDTFPYN